MEGFLVQAFIYLGTAVVIVPFAKKLGLSSILGYLLAGIVIGPFILGLIGNKGTDIMHFAEFGVVMMLFLIGLELDPHQFWKMRKAIVGLGTSQMLGTALLLFLVFHFIVDFSFSTAIVISAACAMSSTAIVLQTLKEKGLMKTTMGESSFAVLLFQDMAIIPILALIPLLSNHTFTNSDHGLDATQDLPGYLRTGLVIGAIGLVYLFGRYMVPTLLSLIAKTRLQELFTASALLLVIAVALLMQVVGLSPALGSFLAGVVLANSAFRHELETDIAPFKGLLLGLFFIGVGASIDFSLIGDNPQFILLTTLGVIVIKFLVLLIIGHRYSLSSDQNLLFAFGLSQVGEFAFVIVSFAGQLNILQGTIGNQIMAVTALSMLLTPFLLLINERFIDPYFGTKEQKSNQEMDTDISKHAVIIAGFGHFGSTVGRMLRANGIDSTILDNDSERVNLLRKMGFRVYYGDATRMDLLHAAGIDNAKLFIAAIDSPEVNYRIIEALRKQYPNLKILARARNRMDAYDLIEHGVTDVYRETLYTAVHLGVDALVSLGKRRYSATRQGQKFIIYDENALEKLAKARHDKKEYILSVKEEIELQEQLLQNDLQTNLDSQENDWDSLEIKKAYYPEQTNR